MTEEPVSILFIFNVHAERRERFADAAYKLHCDVVKGLPLRPVVIWQKERHDFTPEKCIVALTDNRVVGCALLVPSRSADELHDKIEPVLGKDAAEKTRSACRDFNKAIPVYEIAAVCVDPEFRGQGIARQLYEEAAEYSGGNVYAVIAKPNDASRNAALKAGYSLAPASVHSIKYDVEDGRVRPTLSGKEEVIAEIFRPSPG